MSESEREAIHVDVVGDGEYRKQLESLTAELELSHLVTFHGDLWLSDMTTVLAHSHIAIGVLAIHRKGLRMASPLKHREYLAWGLPLVFSGIDPDLPRDLPFVHVDSGTEDPVSISRIIEWRERLMRIPDLQREIKSFARKHLDYKVKAEKALELLFDEQQRISSSEWLEKHDGRHHSS